MRNNILCFILLATLQSFAQEDCNYKIQVDTDDEIFKLTQESLIDFTVGNKKTAFVYFSLMNQDQIKSVVLHISLNATDMPPIICFNEKSRLSFKLSNGTYVSAPYLGEKTCGRQTENENTMNNSTSEASFFLDENALTRLSNTSLESLRIATQSINFDLKLRDVISNEQLGEPIYPKEFFINSLGCIE